MTSAVLTQLHADVSTNTVQIQVDTRVYPKPAVLGAAYVFIDRCFVLLDAPTDSSLQVSLRGRAPLAADTLDALGGEFANELLSQTLRHTLVEQNQDLLQSVVGRAISGAMGPAAEPEFDLSALEALDLDDEPFEDPLGIAISWEEKYGNKRASKKDAAEQKAELAAGETGGSADEATDGNADEATDGSADASADASADE